MKEEEVIEETTPIRGSYLGIPKDVNILPNVSPLKKMSKCFYLIFKP
jgi:hypothetical protein